MGKKSTKMGHSGHFRGMKRAKMAKNVSVGSFLSLAKRSNPDPKKNPAHKNLNPAKKNLNPAKKNNSSPFGQIFGVQIWPILALWWIERAFLDVKKAKKFSGVGRPVPSKKVTHF